MGQMATWVRVGLVSSLCGGSAWAQTRPAAAPPAPPAAAVDAGGTAPQELPKMTAIADPMLVPLPAPEHELSSWRDALVLVHQRSTALHISRAQIDQAVGQTERARAVAMPKLNGTGTATENLIRQRIDFTGPAPGATPGTTQIVTQGTTIPDPAGVLIASLDLRVPVFNLAAWYGVGTAKERERVAELSAKDTERQLLSTVALSAVSVITASRVSESSRVSLASALSTLDLTKRRAALGAASAVDVLRAQQEVELSRAQVVANDESLLRAREALGQSVGDTVGWGVAPNVSPDDLVHTADQICKPVQSLDERSDIQSSAKAVDAAKRDQKGVDYLFAPTVDLTSSLAYISSVKRSPNGLHDTWTVGAQLLWPIYDGGDRYGQRRQTEAALTVARETLTQNRRTAAVQLTQADRAITVALANVEVSTHARDVARESARLSRTAFVNGSGTSFDLVDSARRLREAEIDLLIKEFQVLQARLTAYLARSNCSI